MVFFMLLNIDGLIFDIYTNYFLINYKIVFIA